MNLTGVAWPVWGAVSAAMLAVLLVVFLRRIRADPDGRRMLIASAIVSAAVVLGVVLLLLFRSPAP